MFTNMILPLACLSCTILAVVLVFSLFHYSKRSETLLNLPLFGLLPELLLNFHQIHDKLAKVLEKTNGTFLIKGAWLGQMDTLITSDPANVHCIANANFARYHKGPEWRKRFDIFGNHSMFNTDPDEWKEHRKTFRSFVSHQQFPQVTAKIIPDIIEKGLAPILDHVLERDLVVDLQDLFQRLTFDFASILATGCNPTSLSINFPKKAFSEALDDAWEVILVRYLVPEFFWKLQRWLGIGREKKMSNARRTIDHFCAKHISKKLEGFCKEMATSQQDEVSFNLISCYLSGHVVSGSIPSEEVMRDNMTNLIFATADTTSAALSWFFWLISKNPVAEAKVREELRRNFTQKGSRRCLLFDLGALSKLVYLHAALCETLRLFPSVPVQIRSPIQSEKLPSGHHVNQKTNIVISIYAMARMKSIWGDDCREFKPERWITEDGDIKHEPPHKFFTFNAGPRICLGKEVAFTLMKAVAATIIHNYNVQVLESHPVIPRLSIILRMKYGLMARVKSGFA